MAKRQELLQQKDIRKLLCAILGLISPDKFDRSCTSYISRYIYLTQGNVKLEALHDTFLQHIYILKERQNKKGFACYDHLYILISHRKPACPSYTFHLFSQKIFFRIFLQKNFSRKIGVQKMKKKILLEKSIFQAFESWNMQFLDI